MHPVFLEIGTFKLHSYGLMMVIGFVIGLYFQRKKAINEGINAQKVIDMQFISLVIGLIGGRITFIITQWQYYAEHPLDVFKFWEGGLVFYGGLIAGILSFVVITRRWNLPTLKCLDITAPTMAIGHAFGRIGCFLAGCCHGKQCDIEFPLAVIFKHPETLAPKHIPLHPAQLYDALNAVLIFLFLEWLYKRHYKFTGQMLAAYLMIYAIGRSIVEVFRGDQVRGFVVGSLSTSQFISIFTFSVGLFLYLRGQKSASLKK